MGTTWNLRTNHQTDSAELRDSDAHSKPHIFHNNTHKSLYLAQSSCIPSVGVHTEHTANHIAN